MHSEKSAISALVDGVDFPTVGAVVIVFQVRNSVRPSISSVTTGIMITTSNSPAKGATSFLRDAPNTLSTRFTPDAYLFLQPAEQSDDSRSLEARSGGVVEIESQWTASKREQMSMTLQLTDR